MPIPPFGSPPYKLTAAKVEALFTAKGQIFVGTGSGTGELLATGTTGQFLGVGGADPSGLEWTGAASEDYAYFLAG